MKRLGWLAGLWFASWVQAASPGGEGACAQVMSFLKPSCHRLQQIWYEGNTELQIPAYAWHNRFYYSNHRRYNEHPWGGGLGKSFYDEDGDWHDLYAFAFLDSHKNVEPIAGYGFEKMLALSPESGVGIGYTVFLTSRPDIIHSIPFPGILPLVGITYQRASVTFIYVPGRQNIGNVLFVLAKWVLG